MRSKRLLFVVAMAGLMMGAQPVFAASAAVKQMAGIMDHLMHYPSDAEKAQLQTIIDDKGSSAQEKVVARSIKDLQHHVAAGDVDGLKQVMADASAPQDVRDLAGIVLNISHMPSADDKMKLEAMMK